MAEPKIHFYQPAGFGYPNRIGCRNRGRLNLALSIHEVTCLRCLKRMYTKGHFNVDRVKVGLLYIEQKLKRDLRRI